LEDVLDFETKSKVQSGLIIILIPKTFSNIKTFNHDLYYNNPWLALIQLLFVFTSNPKRLLQDFVNAYSIDEFIKTLFESLVNDEDYEFEDHYHKDKDIQNLKYFLYYINSICTNERELIYLWNEEHSELKHVYDQPLKTKINKLLSKSVKYEAIHTLMFGGNSNLKTIMNYSHAHLKNNEQYEEAVKTYSRCVPYSSTPTPSNPPTGGT
jgi:hypothetical protein